MEVIKAQNAPGFGRDPKTGAVLNINSTAVQQARNAKKARQREKEEIEQLKQDVNDIKSMLTQIVEKL
jgi:hypothetical protein